MDASIEQMLALNREVCGAMLKREVHACTDVTGFGLLGHAREMALASGVTLEEHAQNGRGVKRAARGSDEFLSSLAARIRALCALEISTGAVRLLPGAAEYSKTGAHSGGLVNNRNFVESCVRMEPGLPNELQAPAVRSADFRRSADIFTRRGSEEADGGAAGGLCGRPGRKLRIEANRGADVKCGTNPLIIALDVDSMSQALDLVEKIGPAADFYKIGMELYAAAGMDVVSRLGVLGKKVFLDLKLYDIGETVKRATREICRNEAIRFLTVHGSRTVMRAAVDGRGEHKTNILAVTVLTSFDREDLADLGYPVPVSDLVDLRVRKAVESGMDGVVCSPLEAARVRQVGGPRLKIVTPGVRSAGSAVGDQKRVATPAEAIGDGADYLVIGRQVTRANDPRTACEEILMELDQAMREERQPFTRLAGVPHAVRDV